MLLLILTLKVTKKNPKVSKISSSPTPPLAVLKARPGREALWPGSPRSVGFSASPGVSLPLSGIRGTNGARRGPWQSSPLEYVNSSGLGQLHWRAGYALPLYPVSLKSIQEHSSKQPGARPCKLLLVHMDLRTCDWRVPPPVPQGFSGCQHESPASLMVTWEVVAVTIINSLSLLQPPYDPFCKKQPE